VLHTLIKSGINLSGAAVIAVQSSNPNYLKALFEADKVDLSKAHWLDRKTVLHLTVSVGFAIAHTTEKRTFLLVNGANVNCRDSQGWTPLHEACIAICVGDSSERKAIEDLLA